MTASLGSNGPRFRYALFGLTVASELELPELLPADGQAEVAIHTGPVPEHLESPSGERVLSEASPTAFLLKMPGVARYLASGGSEIIVDASPAAAPEAVRLFLLGVVFAALLNQRGILTLHGSAIATRQGAVVFAGPSGFGKSTLAAAFQLRGYKVIADDVCAIGGAGDPVILPGSPVILLWADALAKLRMGKSPGLCQVRTGIEKYLVPLGDSFARQPVRLHAVYSLELAQSGAPTVVQLSGVEKMPALARNLYREHLVRSMNLVERNFRRMTEIAGRTRVGRANRSRGSWQLDEVADLLVEDFEA